MRELSTQEIGQVSGGFAPLMLYGAGISATVSYLNGDSPRQIATSAVIGALGGSTATLAKMSTGLLRLKFQGQTAGLTILNGVNVTGSGTPDVDIGDQEKVLEK